MVNNVSPTIVLNPQQTENTGPIQNGVGAGIALPGQTTQSNITNQTAVDTTGLFGTTSTAPAPVSNSSQSTAPAVQPTDLSSSTNTTPTNSSSNSGQSSLTDALTNAGTAAYNAITGSSSNQNNSSQASPTSSSSSPSISDIVGYGKTALNQLGVDTSSLVDQIGSASGLFGTAGGASITGAGGTVAIGGSSSLGSAGGGMSVPIAGALDSNAVGATPIVYGADGTASATTGGALDASLAEGSGQAAGTAATDGALTSSSLSDVVGAAGNVVGTAGAGFTVGSLVGGAIGSPGYGAAAGAASGAGTGALIGTYLLPGVGTLVGALVGGIAGALGGVLGGQHPTVGPDANASLSGFDPATQQIKYAAGADNGGNAGFASQILQSSYDALKNAVTSAGGTISNVAPGQVGVYKGKYFFNPTTNVNNAQLYSTPVEAQQAFIKYQLASATTQPGQSALTLGGLTPDQISKLQNEDPMSILQPQKFTTANTSASPQQTGSTPTNYYNAGTSLQNSLHSGTNTDFFGLGTKQGYADGGLVRGPGGPTDDLVPAELNGEPIKLSNKEFIMPADAVAKLGGGSPEAGAAWLTKLIAFARGPEANKFEPPKNVPKSAYADGGMVEEDPNDYTDKYNTELSFPEEMAFQAWAKKNPKLGNTYDYDARGFWLNGHNQAANGHGSDTYKKPNHPTFSDESQYHGVDGFIGGHWDSPINTKSFVPGPANLQHNSPEELQQYFQENEPNIKLVIPPELLPQ